MTDKAPGPVESGVLLVALVCAESSPHTGRTCFTIQQNAVPVSDVASWYAAALAEHGWTVDEAGLAYCPVHNPTDSGTAMTVTDQYRPIGASGWEARLPAGRRGALDIEVRPQRAAVADA